METIIKIINEKLNDIIDELREKQIDNKNLLESVQIKIDEKIDEGRTYKQDIENFKEQIKELETEIVNLENDLKELTERFGNKDLNSIIEAGNKEISNKISSKQNLIANYHTKISELTDKARMVKDLLINLRKDKDSKEKQLQEINSVLNYYEARFKKIVNYADTHPDNLEGYQERTYEVDNYKKLVRNKSNIEDEIMIDEYDDSLPDESENKNRKFDFKSLNKSIDDEYANVFGNSKSLEVENASSLHKELLNVKKNIFDSDDNLEEDSFTTFEDEDITKNQTVNSEEDLVSYLTSKDIDYYGFTIEDQNYLQNIFDVNKFNKVIEVLGKIELPDKFIYDNKEFFEETDIDELSKVIDLLLNIDQSKKNIGLILNVLLQINSNDLNDVINNYEGLIKDADITDIIIKAKRLSEAGGEN